MSRGRGTKKEILCIQIRRTKQVLSTTKTPLPHRSRLCDPLYDLKDSLFIMLWAQWDCRLSSDAPCWIREAQNLTGISPTEVLMVVSRMIVAFHERILGFLRGQLPRQIRRTISVSSGVFVEPASIFSKSRT